MTARTISVPVRIMLLFLLLAGKLTFAQPANDQCSGAILVPVNNGTGCALTVTGTFEYATQSMAPCISAGYPALDVWFKFVATASTHRISIDPVNYRDIIFEIYSGDCSNLVLMSCVNTGGFLEPDMVLQNNLTPGNTYYIKVYDRHANHRESVFTICINTATSFISNDDCEGAAVIAVTPELSFPENYNTMGATQSMPGCSGVAEDDIWFRFTATNPRHCIWVLRTNEALTPVIEVFDGSCGNLTRRQCSVTDASGTFAIVEDLSPGSTYYYRVYGKAANDPRTVIKTSVFPLPPKPANDECTGAILVPVNNGPGCSLTITGTREFATQSMPPCINTGLAAMDVWFKFVAISSTHRITVTPASFRDQIFEIYSGECGSLVQLSCVNTGIFFEPDMVVQNNLVAGKTYYIRVYDKYGNTQQSEFSICINTASTLLDNDECTGAVAIPVMPEHNYTGPLYTTISATQSFPGCFGVAEDDIWFSFTATAIRQQIRVEATNDHLNHVIEVFSGTCGNLNSLGCFYTIENDPTSVLADLEDLSPGTTYYYRVYGKTANSVRTQVKTSVIPLPPKPVNDDCSGAILVPVNNGINCALTVTGNQEFASRSMAPCINTGFPIMDVWFKFVATASTHLITVTPTPASYRNTIFEVYSGNCNNLVLLSCVNTGYFKEADIVLQQNLTPGDTYYIRVYDMYGNTQQSEFTVCINSATSLLTNDECSGAAVVSITPEHLFAGPVFTSLGATQSLPGCFGAAEDDTWYTFTATAARHELAVIATNDLLNQVIEVYGGGCSNLVTRGCFYTIANNPTTVYANLENLVPGTVYHYRVYGKAANSVRTEIRHSIIPLSATLPVTLLYFTAKEKDGTVELNWATSQEINNDHFVVERSMDGIRFQTINIIPGAGNSNTILEYAYQDIFVGNADIIYYRLKQVDMDGTSVYSKIVAIIKNNVADNIEVYPNPVNDKFTVRLPYGSGVALLSVYDISGRILSSQKIGSLQQINISHLANGVYYITVQNGFTKYNTRIIKR